MTAPTPVNARLSLGGTQWCFGKFLDQSTTEIITDDDVICGHIDPEVEGEISGRELNVFSVSLNPTLPMLETLLPYFGVDGTEGSGTGAASPGGPYFASLNLTPMVVMIDKVGATHRWDQAWVNRFILRGQVGTAPISLEIQFIAKQEEEVATPTFTEGDMDYIFGFPGNTFKIDTVAFDIDRFAFVVDRKLVQEWEGSNYLTDIGLGKRESLFACTTPYKTGSYKDIYWNNKRLSTPRDIELVLTNGYSTVTVNLPKAGMLPKSPSIDNVMEVIRLPHTWRARREISSNSDAWAIAFADIP